MQTAKESGSAEIDGTTKLQLVTLYNILKNYKSIIDKQIIDEIMDNFEYEITKGFNAHAFFK